MKLLILSCACGGTHFTAQFFKLLGLDVGHERAGKHGRVDHWFIGVHSRKKTLSRGKFQIFHQVRNPLFSIQSLSTLGDPAWEFAELKKPIIQGYYGADRCVAYWLHWNQEIERWTDDLFRVENFESYCPTILDRCGWGKYLKDIRGILTQMKPGVGSRKHLKRRIEFKWADVEISLRERVIKKAISYGYSEEELELK